MLKRIVLMVVLSCLLTVPAFANEAKTLIQVTGNSQQEVVPDIARMTIGVNSVNADLEKAKSENAQIIDRVLAKLKEQGVTEEQVKRSTYLIDPVYNYEKSNLPKLEGYRVTSSIEIRTGMEKVGVLVNEATNAGANEINSIRFETSNEADSKRTALKDAIADALQKAEVMASALNKRVSHVTLVTESGVYYNPVMFDSRAVKLGREAAVPTIPAGKVTVGANVQVTVALE